MSQTHFGFQQVDEQEETGKVADTSHPVANKYDVMNNLMSGGLHRVWKMFIIAQAAMRPGYKVLDIADGTGDLAKAFARQAGPTGEVWLTDINESMLRVDRGRLPDAGVLAPTILCDVEHIPFPNVYFDVVTVASGLRNMTHKDRALAKMCRVVKLRGKVMVLELSRVWQPLKRACGVYSFKVLPWLGNKVTGDPESYRYLAESIRMYPDQETLKQMMEQAGLDSVEYFNLTAGVVTLHIGRCLQVFSWFHQMGDVARYGDMPRSFTLNFGVDAFIQQRHYDWREDSDEFALGWKVDGGHAGRDTRTGYGNRCQRQAHGWQPQHWQVVIHRDVTPTDVAGYNTVVDTAGCTGRATLTGRTGSGRTGRKART